jgi:hypothetical protein
MSAFRTTGIVGRDFCGSTMLLRLFACVPGVEPVGELHWLLDAPAVGSIKTKAGWSVSRECVVCGSECPVFTSDFIGRNHDKTVLYEQVAKQLNAAVIVSADKMPMHYERFVAPGQMDAIVLYKSPMAQVYSDMKNEERSFDEALLLWTRAYDNIIKWCARPGFVRSAIYVCYEDLAGNTQSEMERICEHLEVQAPPGDLVEQFISSSNLDNRYHCIGCSPHSHRRGEIIVDKHWQKALNDKQKALCTSGEAGVVLSRLERLRRVTT